MLNTCEWNSTEVGLSTPTPSPAVDKFVEESAKLPAAASVLLLSVWFGIVVDAARDLQVAYSDGVQLVTASAPQFEMSLEMVFRWKFGHTQDAMSWTKSIFADFALTAHCCCTSASDELALWSGQISALPPDTSLDSTAQ